MSPYASKKDLHILFQNLGEIVGGACDECRGEVAILREDLQGQLQDILIEVKTLRKEILYSRSRTNVKKLK